MSTNQTDAVLFNCHGERIEPGAPLFPHADPNPGSVEGEGDRPTEPATDGQTDEVPTEGADAAKAPKAAKKAADPTPGEAPAD
jgi:hypothetical protein